MSIICDILGLIESSTFLVNRAEDEKLKEISKQIFNVTNSDERCTVGLVFDKSTLKEIKDVTFSMFLDYNRFETFGEFIFFVVKKFKDFFHKRRFIKGDERCENIITNNSGKVSQTKNAKSGGIGKWVISSIKHIAKG